MPRGRMGPCAAARAVALLVGAAIGLGAAAASARDKVICQLDWLPSGGKAPIFIGVEKGFFAEQGLDVAIASSRGTQDAIIRVATGNADFATGALGTLLQARAEGNVPVKAFFSLYSKLPDAVMTVKGNGVTTIRDLVGKTVGNAPFGGEEALWNVFLQIEGIDPAGIKILEIDPKVHGPMLATGGVDALIDWTTGAPGIAHLVKDAGKELVVMPWSDYGLQGYGFSLFASERMIREHPETVAKFSTAFRKSVLYTIAHPEDSGPAVKAMAPEVEAAYETENWLVSVPLIENEISKRDGIGGFEPGLLKATWELVARAHKFPLDKLDPESAVERSLGGS